MSTIFKKIIDKEIPADIVYEDQKYLAFRDVNPQAPVHILIIPKKEYTGINKMTDAAEIGQLFIIGNRIASEQNLDSGYRFVINQGLDGGQSVFHTHLHLLGGRKLNWPPG